MLCLLLHRVPGDESQPARTRYLSTRRTLLLTAILLTPGTPRRQSPPATSPASPPPAPTPQSAGRAIRDQSRGRCPPVPPSPTPPTSHRPAICSSSRASCRLPAHPASTSPVLHRPDNQALAQPPRPHPGRRPALRPHQPSSPHPPPSTPTDTGDLTLGAQFLFNDEEEGHSRPRSPSPFAIGYNGRVRSGTAPNLDVGGFSNSILFLASWRPLRPPLPDQLPSSTSNPATGLAGRTVDRAQFGQSATLQPRLQHALLQHRRALALHPALRSPRAATAQTSPAPTP